MLDLIEAHLLENWPRYNLGPAPRKLAFLVINGGINVRSKLVCACWVAGSARPALIVKFSRYPEYNSRVLVEYDALQLLQAYLPRLGSAPAPIDSFVLEDICVTVESALDGRPLRAYLREHPANPHRTLVRMAPFAAWLASLHVRSARPASVEEQVLEPFSQGREQLDLSEAESRALDLLERQARSLSASHPLVEVFNHNDPGSTNVMTNRQGTFIGLIDWESGEFGPPAMDLIYFLARFAFETRAAGGPDQLRGYREIFFRREGAPISVLRPELAERWLLAYCRRLGLDLGWLPVLFALGWVRHALNEHDRLLSLRAEGQLLHGKPATVSAVGDEPEDFYNAHFRSQLRYYLENIETSIFAPWARQA